LGKKTQEAKKESKLMVKMFCFWKMKVKWSILVHCIFLLIDKGTGETISEIYGKESQRFFCTFFNLII